MDKYFNFIGFFLAAVTLISSVQAYPTIHNVYGNVYDADGKPVPGVEVAAWIDGTNRGSSVTKDYAQGFDSYYLIDVSGDTEEDGATISFTIDGVESAQTLVYAPLGKTELNLTVASSDSSDSSQKPATSTTITVEQDASTSTLAAVPESLEADSSSSTSLVRDEEIKVVDVAGSPETFSGAVATLMPDDNITSESTTLVKSSRVVEASEDDACYECPEEFGGGVGGVVYPVLLLVFAVVVILILLKRRK